MFAFWVMVIDVGKGWVAAAVLPQLQLPFVGIDPTIDRLWLAVACAAAVVVGHVYPVWYGFRGGKGAATLIGVLLGLEAGRVGPGPDRLAHRRAAQWFRRARNHARNCNLPCVRRRLRDRSVVGIVELSAA